MDSLEDLLESKKGSYTNLEETVRIATLLRRILRYKVEDRTSASELLQDAWFQEE